MNISESRLLQIIRKLFWFKNQQADDERIVKAMEQITEWYQWELAVGRDIPETVQIIEKLKETNKYYKDCIQKHNRIKENFQFELSVSTQKHEAEIIRLKDIIQAKQVQIDKLLENK